MRTKNQETRTKNQELRNKMLESRTKYGSLPVKLRLLTLLILTLLNTNIWAQEGLQLSEEARAGLVTLSPGKELYQAFGHSSIHIEDPKLGLNILYNYGMFDFDTEYFYLKFSTGDLLYSLGIGSFDRFMRYRPYENQTVTEQRFNLNQKQIQQLYDYLENNALPENRDYYYRFFEDNCATRIRDVFDTVWHESIQWDLTLDHEMASYRQIYHEDLGHRQWEAAGLDFLLGSRIDEKKGFWHFMYKPNYLYDLVGKAQLKTDSSTIPLVKESVVLYKQQGEIIGKQTNINILWAIPVFMLLILGLEAYYKKDFYGVDVIYFLIVGLCGTVVLALKLYSRYPEVQANWNIFWCLPTYTIMAITLLFSRRNKFIKYHSIFSGLITITLLLCWYIIPQQFHYSFIPLMLALILRSWKRYQVARRA